MSGALPERRRFPYARLARHYARIGFIRKSQFRWEFFNQVLMDCLYYASFLLTFGILYGLEEGVTLAGWTRDDIRVFLGMAFVTDAFHMMWLGQTWHFGDDLKAGNLDPFRLRPGPVWFTYSFQRFSPEGLTNFVVACAILGWGLWLHPSVGWTIVLLLPWAWTIAFVGQVGISLGFSSLEYWAVNSDLSRFFSQAFSQVGDRPLDVFPRAIKRFFVWAVPLGALCWAPAGLMVGRFDAAFSLAYTALVVAFLYGVTRFYSYGMRRYESAMG